MMHKVSERKIRAGIVGARGYSGLELARILLKHPGAELAACFASETVFALEDYLPEAAAAQIAVRPVAELGAVALDVAFLATPAEVSLKLAPELLARGVKVIDLSGAFRLPAGEYPRWYGFEHHAPEALAQAEYGLVPWCGPSQGARLIANPGCYATAVLMAILPLLREGVIDPASLVIDAKSGASGAGRKAAENLLFTEVDGECLPYKVAAHQHLPEIRHFAHALTRVGIDPHFTTHLLATRRGIIAGIYARLKKPGGVADAYAKAYQGYPLVRHGAVNPRSLSLKRIAGSARTEIRYQVDGDKLYVFSLIDNLMKGAASQAVENFNRMNDYPITTALEELEGVL